MYTVNDRGRLRGKVSNRGFSLIELMIAVAIIGVLASILIPNFTESAKKARRADGQGALTALAQVMERYYSQNNTYVGVVLGTSAAAIFPNRVPTGEELPNASDYTYTLSVTSSISSYTLTATPSGGGQLGDGFLTLDSLGRRGWDRNNDGSLSATEMTWKK